VFYDRKQKRKYKLKKKYTMYIVRYKKGENAYSAPCANCAAKIKQVGIKKIVYCNVAGEIQKENMNNFNSNFLSSGYREYARKNIEVY